MSHGCGWPCHFVNLQTMVKSCLSVASFSTGYSTPRETNLSTRSLHALDGHACAWQSRCVVRCDLRSSAAAHPSFRGPGLAPFSMHTNANLHASLVRLPTSTAPEQNYLATCVLSALYLALISTPTIATISWVITARTNPLAWLFSFSIPQRCKNNPQPCQDFSLVRITLWHPQNERQRQLHASRTR